MPQRFSQDLHVIYRSHETFWGIAPATCRSRKSCHPAGSLPTPNLSRHRRRLRMVPLEKKTEVLLAKVLVLEEKVDAHLLSLPGSKLLSSFRRPQSTPTRSFGRGLCLHQRRLVH